MRSPKKEGSLTVELLTCFKKKKVHDQRSEENKRKRKFSIKDQKKTKEDIHKSLWTRQYWNNTKLSQANKKRKGKGQNT